MRHLFWIAPNAAVGFAAAFVFADVLALPVDVYYLLYFASVTGLVAVYTTQTGLDLREWVRRRLFRAVVFGIGVGLVLVQGVLAHGQTPALAGARFWWEVVWRGIVYGLVDGVLLVSLPWTIVWRAFGAETGGASRKVAAGGFAWIAVLIVTTAYHLGYREFRTSRIVQPNIGSTIACVATIAAANPIASPISHMFMHVGAVIHSPATDLYLPPHRAVSIFVAPLAR